MTEMSKEKGIEAQAQSKDRQSSELTKGKKRKRATPRNGEREGKDNGPLQTLETSNNDERLTTGGKKSPQTIPASAKPASQPLREQQQERDQKRQKPISSPKIPSSSNKSSHSNRPSNRASDNHKPSQKSQNVPPHLLRKRDELLPARKALPIWPQADVIKSALRKNNILVLTGETGSGKSTQVPQFLVNEPWCKKCIAITQPRRVAAISLARRVAEEMGSFMGSQSPAAKVGYSVRFDNATGPNTKIKFLTEGMLLQEMLRDPVMSQYSAVVVDEVHERSVNVDLILGFLQSLVAGVANEGSSTREHPLKVVVMSATADVESLVKFFEDGQPPAGQDHSDGKPAEQSMSRVSTCFVEGRQYPVKTIYLPQPTQDWVESALKIIFQIHYKEPLPGDILVFLTGQDTIEGLEKLVNDYAEGMDRDVPKVSKVLCVGGAIGEVACACMATARPFHAAANGRSWSTVRSLQFDGK